MADDKHVFPVTEWTIKTIPDHGAIVLQLSFLSHVLQMKEEADPGRQYVLSIKMAEGLRDDLDRAIQKLKTAGTPPIEGPTH